MTATPETFDPRNHLVALSIKADHARRLASHGEKEQALERLEDVDFLATSYRLAVGSWDREAIHKHFGLSYANYLVIPRTFLQSMTPEWQAQFVALLKVMEEAFKHVSQADVYDVTAGKEDLLRDMTESQLFAAGVEVSGDDDLGHGPDTKYHRISDGEGLDGDSYGFRPGKDPVPHYNRGRTRVEPRLGGGE